MCDIEENDVTSAAVLIGFMEMPPRTTRRMTVHHGRPLINSISFSERSDSYAFTVMESIWETAFISMSLRLQA